MVNDGIKMPKNGAIEQPKKMPRMAMAGMPGKVWLFVGGLNGCLTTLPKAKTLFPSVIEPPVCGGCSSAVLKGRAVPVPVSTGAAKVPDERVF